MSLQIPPGILKKILANHKVTPEEILECFQDRTRGFLIDTREKNRTDPPTKWFIAQTDYGRTLKICFIERAGDIHIKTAYEPNEMEICIYKKFAK